MTYCSQVCQVMQLVYLVLLGVPVGRAQMQLQVLLCQLCLAVAGHLVDEQDSRRCQLALQQGRQPTALHQQTQVSQVALPFQNSADPKR